MRKVILASILIAVLFSSNYAFAEQFIPYTGTIREHTPDVCVLDNTNGKDYLPLTEYAVNAWANGLNHLTHSHNWNMTVHMVDKVQAANCDIVFNYDLERHDWNSLGNDRSHMTMELGVTSCDDYNYCTINIHLLNMQVSSINQTVVHEFGHALGLGHRLGDTQPDAMAAFLSDDMMLGMAKKFQHLTNDDFLAIIHMYGTTGFHPLNYMPDSPYIINHPTHYKTYCNGKDITGGICDNVFKPSSHS